MPIIEFRLRRLTCKDMFAFSILRRSEGDNPEQKAAVWLQVPGGQVEGEEGETDGGRAALPGVQVPARMGGGGPGQLQETEGEAGYSGGKTSGQADGTIFPVRYKCIFFTLVHIAKNHSKGLMHLRITI